MTVMIAVVAVNFSLDIPRASLKETVATEAGTCAFFEQPSDNTLHIKKSIFRALSALSLSF